MRAIALVDLDGIWAIRRNTVIQKGGRGRTISLERFIIDAYQWCYKTSSLIQSKVMSTFYQSSDLEYNDWISVPIVTPLLLLSESQAR